MVWDNFMADLGLACVCFSLSFPLLFHVLSLAWAGFMFVSCDLFHQYLTASIVLYVSLIQNSGRTCSVM